MLAVSWLELLLSIGLAWWYRASMSFSHTLQVGAFVGLLLYSGLSGGIFYNVRHGYRWAKLVVLLVYAAYVYATTSLPNYLLAGIPLTDFYAGKLPLLLRHVLILGALALMFSKPARQESRRA